MPRITWGGSGSRAYETGIDRGVLFVGSQAGVAWIGLTSVEENPVGGQNKSYYIDGVKYLQTSGPEEYTATINAFTYPDEFGVCDGTAQVRPGLHLTQQRRKSFGFSYRTLIGTDLNPDKGYKIHIVYNALAEPARRNYSSISDSPEPLDFSWTITTKAPAVSGYKHSAHVVIDSRTTSPQTLKVIEDILYGSDEQMSRLPSISELIDIFDELHVLVVTDNGDGTVTIEGPDEAIRMLDSNIFQIEWSTVGAIDEDTYMISSG
ncbi:major tail protein [Streptomyces phage Maya]|uniref:Major tail protein n=8 Tax=Rimavirus rima TaxID=2560784 RepID=A0A515MIN1_9CAUD|nr:major tail protein [Streptomyces phage OlympicHelado]ASU04015.1 major tail protein [Streptomyces phage Spectropatronm]QAY16231.1 major tail protein [Streptomyces phage IceWarrior]QDM56520.1 major tail protein [Streptomyces phage Esketit]QEQ93712.1 major tail protein [Streptomyces phage Jaylociraptor]QEQ94236.1 major tail protein [Streptomyces phage Hoshi]QNN98184.1 major tail protein [Streptomyces phage Maya]QWY81418.1 major tail protein [Streptomyces phage TaidaOne]